jgi:hypothetical protein
MDWITIREACRMVGGYEKPIHPSTYYRGVAAGRYPAPEHPSPGIARVRRSKLQVALDGGAYAPRAA